ncbi:MAG: CPBP family intramembrane metalloprotease [Bacteroidales bacterium]|nr:CPBP family intramembrane metalloprotease [Bacteroidales bacterium]MDT8432420.1 CPBP family intramembrane glutamic endopeptidase [Bacteroidales bacterium]
MNYDRKPVLSGHSPFAMLIFSSLGVILTGLVFQLIGMLLATFFYDISVFEILDITGEENKKVISAVKFLQIIGALGTFVFSSLLISFFYTGSWLGYFRFGKMIRAGAVLMLIVIMVTALPAVNMLTDLNARLELPFAGAERYLRQLEEQTQVLMMALVRADNFWALLVNLFMIAIIPAVGEELVFRGLIQRHLTDLFRNGHVAIIVASVIFSLAHFQFYSFLPRFFLGMILGYAFYYGRSLWYPMIAHLVNNTLGVVFYYFYMKEAAVESLEDIGTMELMPVTALISLMAVGVLMYLWISYVRISRSAQPAAHERG